MKKPLGSAEQNKNENLPPLNQGGSRQSIQVTNQRNVGKKSELEEKVEGSLVDMLQQKYSELAKQIDKSDIE